MIAGSMESYRQSKEYAYRKIREEHIEEMLDTNLTKDQRELIDEVLFEFGVMREEDGNRLYEQGMKDCVMVLRELGGVVDNKEFTDHQSLNLYTKVFTRTKNKYIIVLKI